MGVLEEFFLANPYLMSPEVWRVPSAIFLVVYIAGALFLVFKNAPSREFLWSSLEGKCFRLSWCVGIFAMAALICDEWFFPEQAVVSSPELIYGLFSLQFLLFGIAMIIALRKALKIHSTSVKE